MTHPVASHDGTRNFDTAFFTHDAFVPDTAIFAAVTFEIFVWPEDFFVKQAIALAPLRAIVNGLRFSHFAMRPFFDTLGRSQFDADEIKLVDHVRFDFVVIHWWGRYQVSFLIPRPARDHADYST